MFETNFETDEFIFIQIIHLQWILSSFFQKSKNFLPEIDTKIANLYKKISMEIARIKCSS